MSKKVPLSVPDIGDSSNIELVNWHVSKGDTVSKGEELCELVTDKATFPLESPHDGKVIKIEKGSGSLVKVGETLICLEVEEPC